MEYFNQLLESYSLLKKRKLKIGKILTEQDSSVVNPNAEAQAMQALGGVPEPSNQYQQTLKPGQVIGQNKGGGDVLLWKGKDKDVFMMGTAGGAILTVGDVNRQRGKDFNRLVAFFSGGEGEGILTPEMQKVQREQDLMLELDDLLPGGKLGQSLKNICESINDYILKQGTRMEGDLKNPPDYLRNKDVSVQELAVGCFSKRKGSLAYHILNGTNSVRELSRKSPDSPILKESPLELTRVGLALDYLNSLINKSSLAHRDSIAYKQLQQSLAWHETDDRFFAFVKLSPDDFGTAFDTTLNNPLNLVLRDIVGRSDDAGYAIPRTEELANFTRDGGNISNIRGQTTEGLSEVLSFAFQGNYKKAGSLLATIVKEYGENLESAQLLADSMEDGLGTEQTMEISKMLDEIADQVGLEGTSKDIARRLLNKTARLLAPMFQGCQEKGAKGTKRSMSVVRVGGKTGAGLMADMLQFTKTPGRMQDCLRSEGLSKAEANKMVVKDTIGNVVRTYLLTRKESTDPKKIANKIKELQDNGQLAKGAGEDTEIFWRGLPLKVYLTNKGFTIGEGGDVKNSISSIISNSNTHFIKTIDKMVGGIPKKFLKNMVNNLTSTDDLFNLSSKRLAKGLTGTDLKQLVSTFSNQVKGILQKGGFTEKMSTQSLTRILDKWRRLGPDSEGSKNLAALLNTQIKGQYTAAALYSGINETNITNKNLTSDALEKRKALMSVVLSTGMSDVPMDTYAGFSDTGELLRFNTQKAFNEITKGVMAGTTEIKMSKRGEKTIYIGDYVKLGFERDARGAQIPVVRFTKEGVEKYKRKQASPLTEESVESLVLEFLKIQKKLFSVMEA